MLYLLFLRIGAEREREESWGRTLRTDICTCCRHIVARRLACKYSVLLLFCLFGVCCVQMDNCAESLLFISLLFASVADVIISLPHLLIIQIEWKRSEQSNKLSVRSELSIWQSWYQQRHSRPASDVCHGYGPGSAFSNTPNRRASSTERGTRAATPDLCAHYPLTGETCHVCRASDNAATGIAFLALCSLVCACFLYFPSFSNQYCHFATKRRLWYVYRTGAISLVMHGIKMYA